jgi:CRISPR/Cas system-associated exonuclease Cas4 (RecB family)
VRTISYTEASTALTCEARHAFAYTGRLSAGRTFKRREFGATLSNGRAWGAAIAAWHAGSAGILGQLDAHAALHASLARDVAEQGEQGFWISLETQIEIENHLMAILDHHMETSTPWLNLTRLEERWLVPIPSRAGGGRASSRYKYECYIDGFTIDERGNEWIAEYKLRGSLTPVWQIQLSRQIRWEAWARQQMTDREVVGALVDERLAEAPDPPRLVRARRKSDPQDEHGRTPSHSTSQRCTPRAYIALCEQYGVEPREEVALVFKQRQWHQQVPLTFTQAELNEAGEELVSAAMLIRDLDLGNRYPLRNAQPYICRGCRFKEVCPNPGDDLYLDTLYARTVPKRLRVDEVPSELGGPTHTPTNGPETSDTSAPQRPPETQSASVDGMAFDFAHAEYPETEAWHFGRAA